MTPQEQRKARLKWREKAALPALRSLLAEAKRLDDPMMIAVLSYALLEAKEGEKG